MMKQNAHNRTDSKRNKPSTKSSTSLNSETEAQQRYWDKYKTLSTTIWKESQQSKPRTKAQLLQESQELHLLKTWLMSREELNQVEYRDAMPLPERVWKLICEEADYLAEMYYWQNKGLGMNLIDNTTPTDEPLEVLVDGDIVDHYTGQTN